MDKAKARYQSRIKRKRRIRKKISGTASRPRLCVFRSSRHIYAQIVDDAAGKTLAAVSSLEKSIRELPPFESKVAAANHIGKVIAERAKEKGISSVVFDRNGFLYHGRIKAVSDGARKAGLEF